MTEEAAAGFGRSEPGRPATAGGNRTALDRLLGVPEMAWLVSRVRPRILAARGEPLTGAVQLTTPTDDQRAAAVRLVGRPRRTGSALRVDLAVVEEVLRRGPWPPGLADAVETLSGPVVDKTAERAAERAAWDAAYDALLPAAARFSGLGEWWGPWCAEGGLKRAARAEAARASAVPSPEVGADLVRGVAAVFERLPAAAQPLAVLAREAVGDAHGLDDSRALGRLARAAARAAFLPDQTEEEVSTRDVWAAAGVVLSNVASTALCLGVPGADPASTERIGHSAGTATAASLDAMRGARVPVVLTLDQVRSGGVRTLPRGSVVHVCENPTVVEVIADRWAKSAPGTGNDGAFGPVLVCTSGQPGTAVIELLQALSAGGAELRYHGDFDWGGLRIARSLGATVTWVPWRYTTAHYVAAARSGQPARQLTGRAAPSPWDPELTVAMREWGVAVEEEAVADLLATDVLTGWTSPD